MEYKKLQNDLRTTMYEVLHAQLVVRIENFNVRISSELLESAKNLRAAGKVNAIDVLKFQTTFNEAKLKQKQAQNDEEAAWRRLATLLGTPDFPQQPIRGSLLDEPPLRDLESCWAVLEQASPQIAIAKLKVQQARTNLCRQEAERHSNITLAGTVSQDVTANNTVPFFSASVPLKVYDRNQGNIRKAQAELAAAQREVERVSLSLRKELTDVYRDFQNAQELTQAYEASIIPDTYEALRQINRSYNEGGRSYLELYNQRHDIMATMLNYVNALKDQMVAATLLDGLLLRDSL